MGGSWFCSFFRAFAYSKGRSRASHVISDDALHDLGVHGHAREIVYLLVALLFTIVVHELYNFTVVMGNAYTYDRFFY